MSKLTQHRSSHYLDSMSPISIHTEPLLLPSSAQRHLPNCHYVPPVTIPQRPSLPPPRKALHFRLLPPLNPDCWELPTPVSPPRRAPRRTTLTQAECDAFDRRRKGASNTILQRRAIAKVHSEGIRLPGSLKRRLGHNLSEQKRRESINIGFERLKKVVPGCDQVDLTRAQLLARSADYILQLERQAKCLLFTPSQSPS